VYVQLRNLSQSAFLQVGVGPKQSSKLSCDREREEVAMDVGRMMFLDEVSFLGTVTDTVVQNERLTWVVNRY
jgi:hypothetical protein